MEAPTLVAPAHLWVPPHAGTSGPEVAELAADAGLVLDDEQRLVLDAMLAERPDGRWAAFEAAVVMARQNGKTVALEALVLGDLFLFGAELVVWSAHHFATAMEAFRALDEIIAGCPAFARRVKRVSQANGEEGFELYSGQRCLFKARTKTGGRGLTGDRVILDEALFLGAAEVGSLLPTTAARPNPQIVYASSAGTVGSAILRDIRDRGRAGGDPSLAYVEWCAPDPAEACRDGEQCDHARGHDGCAADDPEQWRRANPQLDRRVTQERIRAFRRSMPPAEFVREFLGWWDIPAAGVSGIPVEAWEACADRDAVLADEVVLAFDCSPELRSAAVVACAGPVHVVEAGAGTAWVAPLLARLTAEKAVAAIGYDPHGPAVGLLQDLERSGLRPRTAAQPDGILVPLEGRDAAAACEQMLAGVLDRTLVHRDQRALNDAVAGAGRRAHGDSWRWSRRDSDADISPLVAATVARYLWAEPPAPPAPEPWAMWG